MSVFKKRAEERQRRLLAARATELDAEAGREAALRALEAEAGALLEAIVQYLEAEMAEAKDSGYLAEVHRIRDDHSPFVGAELSFAYILGMMPSQAKMQFRFRITIGEDKQVRVSYICSERGQQALTLIPAETIGSTGQADILPRVEASLEKFVEATEQVRAEKPAN